MLLYLYLAIDHLDDAMRSKYCDVTKIKCVNCKINGTVRLSFHLMIVVYQLLNGMVDHSGLTEKYVQMVNFDTNPGYM